MAPPDAHLTSFLTPPETFLNVSSAHDPGSYLFGYPDFRVRDVRVAGLLHRSYAGAQEDLVLGVISVMLIALLSEIVQTVLMRTRSTSRLHRVSRTGFNTAFVLDEAYHFRNVWGFLSSDDERQNSRRRSVAINSLIIIAIALLLLAAEVFAVYLTQPFRVYTAKYQYNLKGVQPAGTSLDTAVGIDLLTSKKRCITPSMMHSNQSREYTLNACIMRSFERALDTPEDTATFVVVESFYHEAGSDHVITFGDDDGNNGTHEVAARASIMQGQSGVSKGVLFEVRDDDEKKNAKYLQMYMVYTAMQWNCDQDWETRSCKSMMNQLEPGQTEIVTKEIVLWEKKEETRRSRKGVKTRFSIELRQPFVAVQAALHVFTTSAVIKEVEGRGMYVDMNTNEHEEGVEGLVSEEGRIAGVVLLSLIFIALFVVLIILRCCFKPRSLARIARDAMVDDFDLEMQGEDFIGAERQTTAEYPVSSPVSEDSSDSPRRITKILSLGRKGKETRKEQVTDLSDFVSDDYESTMTFEGGSSHSANSEGS